jgi:hypothetical protein
MKIILKYRVELFILYILIAVMIIKGCGLAVN